MRAQSRGEIDAMLAADPAVVSGLFVPRVDRWWPRFRRDEPLPH